MNSEPCQSLWRTDGVFSGIGGEVEMQSKLLEILKEILNELILIRIELQAIRLSTRRRRTNVHIDSRELAELSSKAIQKDIRDFKRREGGTCSGNS